MPVPTICLTLDTLGHCAEAIKRQKGNEHVPRTEHAQVLYDYCMDHNITKIGPVYVDIETYPLLMYRWWVQMTLDELEAVEEVQVPFPERQVMTEYTKRWLQHPVHVIDPPVHWDWDMLDQIQRYVVRLPVRKCMSQMYYLTELITRNEWAVFHLPNREQLGVRLLHVLNDHLPPIPVQNP